MKTSTRTHHWLILCWSLTACASHSPPVATSGSSAATASSPRTLYTLEYVAGPNWKAGLPPQQQELGPHFGYVAKLFKDHTLVANGIYGDEVRGLYVLSVGSEGEANRIVAEDPAIKSGVLVLDRVAPWTVLFDGFGATESADASYFILDYGPGEKWVPNKPATEQNLAAHMGYMAEKLHEGKLIAAGPVGGTDHGRYIVATSSKEAAQAMVVADPGVRAQVVRASLRPWFPAQRQALTHGGT
jgi:uncharacterized protein